MSASSIAASLNEEGKKRMFASQFDEAARKFQEAVARVPEPTYFFNLCVARFQSGRFDEALTACLAVDLNNPSKRQQDKAHRLIARIRGEAREQGIELHEPPPRP